MRHINPIICKDHSRAVADAEQRKANAIAVQNALTFQEVTFGFPRLEERVMHCYLSLAQCLTAACAKALTQSAWDVCA